MFVCSGSNNRPVLDFSSLRYDEASMNTTAHWLTAKRLTAHGLLLAVALWSLYVWTVATPGLRDRNGNLKGTDFLHLYTLGSLARAQDGAHLYDMSYQAALAADRVPAAAGIRYLPLYPPQVSLIFVPFAAVTYAQGLVLWWILSAFIYALCCYAIWRECANLRHRGAIVVILAIALPGFFHLIAWGQTSALALACFTGTFLFLRRKQEFLAGLVFGCLIFKPQLALAAAILFLGIGAWKILTGALISAVLEMSAGAMYYGVAPVREWISTLLNTRSVLPLLEPRLYQTHSLRTFWSMLLPWGYLRFSLYIITAALTLFLTFSLWRRRNSVPLALRYPAMLLATVLISPHLTVYDLVILAPGILLLVDWLVGQDNARQNRIGTLLYLVYALPLLGPLTRWTHVQLSVLAMAALLYMLWRASQSSFGVSESGYGVASARVGVPAG